MIPSTDKIVATFGKAYIHTYTSGDRFAAALRTVEAGIEAGKIYNQEFLAAKYYIAGGCEHAQHVAADIARKRDDKGNTIRSYGDCRDNIGYAFGMNQAAKASRELKKLAKRIPAVLEPGTAEYILTLDQIDAIWKWLQSVKPIIVKGRKPAENPKPVDISNTGHCAICESRFKLEKHGKRAMVHHGFRISDRMGHYFGHRAGKCFGTAYEPYELSNQANKEYKYFLQQELKDAERWLGDLMGSVPAELGVQEYKKGIAFPVTVNYARGTKEYEKERQHRISQTESEIRWLNDAIPYQQTRIDKWVPVALAD